MFDLLIKNGTIIDGTGAGRFIADIGIINGQINFIGKVEGNNARKIIDASEMIITPGFIDCHSHGDYNFLADSDASNLLLQGVTTELAGHCGLSVSPCKKLSEEIEHYITKDKCGLLNDICQSFPDFIDYVDNMDLATNMAFFVGHGSIRDIAMGFENRKPSEDEMKNMKSILQSAMEAGALGMSSGLIYPPGVYADEEEITELLKVISPYGGVYTSHMRSEGDKVIESVEETIRAAKNADVAAVISHHKIIGKDNWGKSAETLKLVDEANKAGMKVRMDQYPFIAGATALINSLPPEYANDGRCELLKKLKDEKIRLEMKNKLSRKSESFENLIYSSGLDGVYIGKVAGHDDLSNKSILEISKILKKDPYDVIFDLIIQTEGALGARYFIACEDDTKRIMKHSYTMVGTDSTHLISGVESLVHPRFTSTYPRVLSYYIRGLNLMPLEEMIKKICYLPVEINNIKNKGVIKENYDADLVIMDYYNLSTESSFDQPFGKNHGMEYVIVNGQIAVEHDELTGVKAGKLIKKSVNM